MDGTSNVAQLFEEQVKNNPQFLAVLEDKKVLTYTQFNAKANKLAHYLKSLGLTEDTPVALCMERSTDVLIAMMAILKAGGAYLPLDASQPSDRLLLILENSNAPIVISTSEFQAKFATFAGKLVVLDKLKINQQPTTNLSPISSPQQLAYIIYTSGSTGTPKGVQIEHRNVVNYTNWFAQYSACKVQQRIDFSSNHIFDMAVTISIVPLMLGLTITICDEPTKKDIRKYLHYLQQFKVETIKLTPSYFKVLIDAIKNQATHLPYLKSLILGGENLSTADCKAWIEHYPNHVLFNEYGPTETTVGVTQFKVSKDNVDSLGTYVPIGLPGAHISCYILNAEQVPVTGNEAGELYIGGACVARGYLNQEELTHQQFRTDPFSHTEHTRMYKTGDLCNLNSDGYYECIGRIDHQLKIRGFRIEPAEIEKHMATHPCILAATVLAQQDALNEKRLVAYYTLQENSSAPGFNELREYLQDRVPDYMIPNAFVCVASFPLTANGKLDRAALPIPEPSSSRNFRAPVTEIEKELAKIWSKELGIPVIGLDDDFFELGGHSLSAARIISQINNTTKKPISLQDFYQTPTVAQLSTKIKPLKSRVRKIRRSTKNKDLRTIPLSDFQLMLWLSNTFEVKAKKLNITARKRVCGKVNKEALEFAFAAVLKKQKVFSYQVMKLKPIQKIDAKVPFEIKEMHLQSLAKKQAEQNLEQSMSELINFYPWPKEAPLLIARLFYLSKDIVELQICMSHIICDDLSPQILFAELTKFYNQYTNQDKDIVVPEESAYKDYILDEQQYFQRHIDRDIHFWDNYLHNASLFSFPKNQVVKNRDTKEFTYSTYTKIPAQALQHLKQFCAHNHLSINDGLGAALLLALHECSEEASIASPYLYMNIVKSTRDNPDYDETIGCFLRLEPVKIAMDNNHSLESLAAQIHQATMETSPYQRCPSLVKLASTNTLRLKSKTWSGRIVDTLTSIYSRVFGVSTVYSKILKLCGGRLATFDRTNNFLINLNVQNNFINESSPDGFLGFDSLPIKNQQHDLLSIDSILDVCFIRDADQNNTYVVLSANLQPHFREQIAAKIIQLMIAADQENLAAVGAN